MKERVKLQGWTKKGKDRQTEKEKDKEKDKEKERERDKEKEREREKKKDTEREKKFWILETLLKRESMKSIVSHGIECLIVTLFSTSNFF